MTLGPTGLALGYGRMAFSQDIPMACSYVVECIECVCVCEVANSMFDREGGHILRLVAF